MLRVGDTELREGDLIAIDGSTGRVTADDVPLAEPETDENFETVLGWADELRRLGVRANADTPEDAARAREFGAEGIGLCRTEHMFMAADRQPKMRAMIMAESTDDRRAALAELLPLQQHDFEGLFEAMAGLPVTIRLLDPPLHEFLPSAEDLAVELERARGERPHDAAPPRAHARARARARGDEPDARHARRAARHHRAGDLRRAGRGDRRGGPRGARAARRVAARGDHDPAGRLRAGGRRSCARASSR